MTGLPARDEAKLAVQDRVGAEVERDRRQRARNWAVFAMLIGFAVLIFAVTIVKMTLNR